MRASRKHPGRLTTTIWRGWRTARRRDADKTIMRDMEADQGAKIAALSKSQK
jgi:hypothetical protein